MAISQLMAALRDSPETVFDLSPIEFEQVIGEILASFGWEISGASRPPGREIDIVGISRDAAGFETTWAVELKLYASGSPVGQSTIYQVYAATRNLGLQRVMLVTSSHLTRAAADASTELGIFVADREVVLDWLSNYETASADLPHSDARQFRSCFVSHSHRDQTFATRLVRRLRADEVRVWFAPEDLRPGQKITEEVGKAIDSFDRLILVLSEESMHSHWVKSEVRRAHQREIQEGTRVLFPLSLVPFDVVRDWELFDSDLGEDLAAVVREYFIPDFSDWGNESAFEEQVQALLEGLRADP